MTNYSLEIESVSKTYKQNQKKALNKVNLKINKGDFFALLGANGAGKTTLIGIITGLVKKDSGKIKIFGLDWDSHVNTVKAQIGVVPQEFNFNPFEKVKDIIINQAGFYGIPREIAITRCNKLLKALELQDKANQASRTLSGGMKRRLMIARALIHEPKLLILDEPTAGVDVELRHGMWKYLKQINKNGTTILLTTHYLEEAEQLCQNIAIIKNGEIVKNDSTKNILNSIENETYIITTENQIPSTFKDSKFKITDNNCLEITITKEENLNQVLNELSKQNIEIKGISLKGNRLEQLFLEIIKN